MFGFIGHIGCHHGIAVANRVWLSRDLSGYILLYQILFTYEKVNFGGHKGLGLLWLD